MKFHPIEDRVVVTPLEMEEKTAGGIVLPDTAKEKQTQGEVVAVGRGKVLPSGKLVEPTVKVGDRVIYGKYAGSDIKIGTKEYKILGESEILAIVD
jgi:chaperonin GroES